MSTLTRVSPLQKSVLKAPLRIVAIGGGTGLSTLLSGLKKHARGSEETPEPGRPVLDITAVVTVSDDGGSSGRLRRDLDIPPPGDIRNCMAALSEDEPLLCQLFQYRFASGRGLKGHSFGNLFLAAMHEITGDFVHAVKLSSEILAIRGRIFPATSAKVTLEALLTNRSIVRGETSISKSRQPIELVRLRPENCPPLPETLEAIGKADLITLGPGSLYTSVIPNVLVDGISDAISRSPALKVYFVNLMWQPGETINFSASRHVEAIHTHARRPLIDCVVLNTAPIPAKLRRKYAAAHVRPVENDFDNLEGLGLKVVTAELLEHASTAPRKVRHNPGALAEVVIDLASRSRAQQVRREALMAQRARVK
ncbi:MAG: YvcK family protein [Acidobacteriaceae bacterium]|nr:YvcK family protein [Acidobacteriaceae bacterium]MBV9781970.1 YvcK family protein [Acidobacteriaceae bacterium]